MWAHTFKHMCLVGTVVTSVSKPVRRQAPVDGRKLLSLAPGQIRISIASSLDGCSCRMQRARPWSSALQALLL